jgi:hypothetical protein
MSETKTYVFGQDGNTSLNALLPFLQQRGIDPAYLYGMMGNNGFFGNNGIEGIIGLIVVLALIGGYNGNGFGLFGGNGNNNSNNYAYDALLSAIQRNGTDVSQLAQTVGVSSDRIHDAIGQVSTQICNLAGQNGMSFQQVTNAILSGNAQLASQLCDCCCSVKQLISESNYLTERGFCNTNQILSRGFSDLGYAFRDQTCDLKQSASANTASIIAKLDAIEDSRKDRELAEKDRMIATLTARSERQAELQPIYSALHELQCNQPEVAKIPYIPAAGNYLPVNYSVPMHFGVSNYGGCGYNYGC